MKRVCLFAGYNYSNVISKYVLDYLKELSKYADIYYLADGQLNEEQLDCLNPFVKGSWVENHGGYDFYSWKLLITKHVGWKNIQNYDELILANDSCFCVNPFAPVFNKMDTEKDLDIWGLIASDASNITEVSTFKNYIKKKKDDFYIGSYFWCVRKKFFVKKEFRSFFNNIEPKIDRNDVYKNYELGIMKLVYDCKAEVDCFDNMIWRYSSVYMRDAFNLIKSGFPLLKVRIFVDNIGEQPLMLEIAEQTEKFCKFKYLQYVEQIRSQREVKVKKTQGYKISKIRSLKYYILPPILLSLFHIRNWKKILKYARSIFSYMVPPVFINIMKVISERQPKSRDRHAFSFVPRPEFGGYYPCHIKNYDKIQKNRAKVLKDSKTMVIFFNVMRTFISGGMLSIDRFIEHSLPIAQKNGFDVVLSNIPLECACITNPYFDYSIEPIDFNYIRRYANPDKLMLNIPECFVSDFLSQIHPEGYIWLWSIPDLRINILNQNDDLMPSQDCIEELRTLCNNKLTITAAHQRYCTKQKEAQYRCKMYLLTPFLPNFYRLPFNKKEKIIILSPDQHTFRNKVISLLKRKLPDYKLVTVKKMKLDDYKHLISKALFAITFGEGYDGYFIEPYLSNSISFSVRNIKFFPDSFTKVPTVYDSWKVLLENIVRDIRSYEKDPNLYNSVSNEVENEIRRFTNNKQSEKDLESLYERFGEEESILDTLNKPIEKVN